MLTFGMSHNDFCKFGWMTKNPDICYTLNGKHVHTSIQPFAHLSWHCMSILTTFKLNWLTAYSKFNDYMKTGYSTKLLAWITNCRIDISSLIVVSKVQTRVHMSGIICFVISTTTKSRYVGTRKSWQMERMIITQAIILNVSRVIIYDQEQTF